MINFGNILEYNFKENGIKNKSSKELFYYMLNFSKKNNNYDRTVGAFYNPKNDIVRDLGKPLKLIELKEPPSNKASVFKEIKKGDDISIAYYIEKINNKIIYDVYAIDGQNRFFSSDYGTIIHDRSEIDLTESNARYSINKK